MLQSIISFAGFAGLEVLPLPLRFLFSFLTPGDEDVLVLLPDSISAVLLGPAFELYRLFGNGSALFPSCCLERL